MQCEHDDCSTPADVIVTRKGYDVWMCWEHYKDYLASEADYIEYQIEDR